MILRILGFQIAPHFVGKYIIPTSFCLYIALRNSLSMTSSGIRVSPQALVLWVPYLNRCTCDLCNLCEVSKGHIHKTRQCCTHRLLWPWWKFHNHTTQVPYVAQLIRSPQRGSSPRHPIFLQAYWLSLIDTCRHYIRVIYCHGNIVRPLGPVSLRWFLAVPYITGFDFNTHRSFLA